MTNNTGPELSFGADAAQTSSTAEGTTLSTAEEARRGARILLITGAVLTVISLIVMLAAGSDTTITWRRSEWGTWVLLLPSLVAVFGGAYGMTVRKAYEQENAAKGFIGAAVAITVIVAIMVVKVFA